MKKISYEAQTNPNQTQLLVDDGRYFQKYKDAKEETNNAIKKTT